MRIIAGTAKGRRLEPPAGRGVRPTADRIKEAWFSSLAPRLPGASVLDLYSGSGALGLEAASRGAKTVVAVERGRAALTVIEQNVESSGLAVAVVAADVRRAVGAGGAPLHPVVVGAAPFDLVLADPPYGIEDDQLAPVLAALAPLLAPAGEVWLETGRRDEVPWPDTLRVVRTRRYGDTVLHTADLAEGTP